MILEYTACILAYNVDVCSSLGTGFVLLKVIGSQLAVPQYTVTCQQICMVSCMAYILKPSQVTAVQGSYIQLLAILVYKLPFGTIHMLKINGINKLYITFITSMQGWRRHLSWMCEEHLHTKHPNQGDLGACSSKI